MRTNKRLLCVGVGVGSLILALVRATFDAFLALFANAIDTTVLNTKLDAALTRTGFVAAFTCIGTVGTLQGRLK